MGLGKFCKDGKYGNSLKQARELATEARYLVSQRKNPIEERQKELKALKQSQAAAGAKDLIANLTEQVMKGVERKGLAMKVVQSGIDSPFLL